MLRNRSVGRPTVVGLISLVLIAVASAVASTASAQPAPGFVFTKVADDTTVETGGSTGFTITITNLDSGTGFLGSIIDTLPPGFVYTPGSTTGLTTADPTIDGQTLTWDDGYSIAVGSSTMRFGVTVTALPDNYVNSVTGIADTGVPVTPGTAPVLVVPASTTTTTTTTTTSTTTTTTTTTAPTTTTTSLPSSTTLAPTTTALVTATAPTPTTVGATTTAPAPTTSTTTTVPTPAPTSTTVVGAGSGGGLPGTGATTSVPLAIAIALIALGAGAAVLARRHPRRS